MTSITLSSAITPVPPAMLEQPRLKLIPDLARLMFERDKRQQPSGADAKSIQDAAKTKVGKALAARLKDGDFISVGTGSTVNAAIEAIAAKIRDEGLKISAITTSPQTALACARAGIFVVDLDLEVARTGGAKICKLGFDGADYIDLNGRLIKGYGGAADAEKRAAFACEEFLILADDGKIIDNFQDRFIPVEVSPCGAQLLMRQLVDNFGATEVKLVMNNGFNVPTPHRTEGGNLIVHAKFPYDIPADFEAQLGLVSQRANGLFTNHASEILVADALGEVHSVKIDRS